MLWKTNFPAAVGGLLGLGVGFSLLSLMEILYFCGLRSCLRRRRPALAPVLDNPLSVIDFEVEKRLARHLHLHIWCLFQLNLLMFNHDSIKECARVPRGGTKNWLVPSLIEDMVSNGFNLMEVSDCFTSSTENQRASSNSDLSTSRISSPRNKSNHHQVIHLLCFMLLENGIPLTTAWHPIMRLLVGKDQCWDAL